MSVRCNISKISVRSLCVRCRNLSSQRQKERFSRALGGRFDVLRYKCEGYLYVNAFLASVVVCVRDPEGKGRKKERERDTHRERERESPSFPPSPVRRRGNGGAKKKNVVGLPGTP